MTMISNSVPAGLARRGRLPQPPWRVVAWLVALAEAFVEAKAIAHAAHRRYPFVD
jgi:hypothetical protein